MRTKCNLLVRIAIQQAQVQRSRRSRSSDSADPGPAIQKIQVQRSRRSRSTVHGPYLVRIGPHWSALVRTGWSGPVRVQVRSKVRSGPGTGPAVVPAGLALVQVRVQVRIGPHWVRTGTLLRKGSGCRIEAAKIEVDARLRAHKKKKLSWTFLQPSKSAE